MISDSFHYWVRPNLDVLYCLTNYDGSSFHSYEALILELSSCRPNIGRTNDIFNAAWPYMACSQFIYRQSSFLFRSGSALDSSLSRCIMASVYLNLPSVAYGNSIPLSSLIHFTPELKRSFGMITAQLTSCARLMLTFSPCCSHCKDLLIQLSGSDCCMLINKAL